MINIISSLTKGVTITSTNQPMVEKARGEKVTLPCTFTVSQEDQGPLDVEWVLIPTDNQKKEQTIIMYSVDRIYNDYYEAMNGRVQFTNPDPRSGDGSINIVNLKSADTGTYQCRVKKAPGIESLKIRLIVLVKPARTKCYIEGSQETGRDLTLKCVSQEGSPLLSYNWRKLTGTKELPATSLTVCVSEEYSGTYNCVAANRVGADDCFVVLNVTPRKYLLKTVLLFLHFYFCNRKKQVDASPPKSRTSTARSYIGSNRSSLGSMSPSKMEGYATTPYNQVPSEDLKRSPAAPNRSRMGAVPVMIPAQSKDGSIV
uniref:Ig-like domain-containing protein n=1 Tax=Gopherus evgoodei TaxID=1825980 RepID=A0A8C4YVV4_9SAUR